MVELAGEPTGNTVVLAGRAGSCHGRARRRIDRRGRARRASQSETRSCSPGELACVVAELAGESTGNTVVLAGRAGSCRGRARQRVADNTVVLAGRAGSCHGRARRAIRFGYSFSWVFEVLNEIRFF
ncbi:hypothetical protein F2Q69_00052850 [Brassica cretica]|uniref:Uncharacterized protein n=1 Tax=Brassica cretica TaxID=69181 RepID=A0A8S9MTC0_BRACR|nr:hypothetical protein F2Q69_00052850 [Brassica cretica]